MCLCDREPLPPSPQGPLDVRNVRHAHLDTVGANYPWDRLKVYHYLDADLEPFAQFSGLKSLSIDWAPKVTDVSPVGTLKSLQELFLRDLPVVRDLAPIRGLSELKALSISGGVWKALRIETLSWISSLEELRTLELFNVKVADDDITVLAQLPRLESLSLANRWPIEQFAVLAAKFGTALKFPAPMNELGVKCPKCGGCRVMLIGRGRPILCRHCDAARLHRELEKYERALQLARATV